MKDAIGGLMVTLSAFHETVSAGLDAHVLMVLPRRSTSLLAL